MRAALLGTGVRGRATGTFVAGSKVYASSIDPAINDLDLEYTYDPGFRNQPILFAGHGYQDNNSALDDSVEGLAARGMFVIRADMRERGALGQRDASGRELMDIWDARQAILVDPDFDEIVDRVRAAGTGYSGGGGNMLGLGMKFPDLCHTLVSHYGMGDYERWYNANAASQALLEADIGDDPTGAPGAYASRNAIAALPSLLSLVGIQRPGLQIISFHDEDDVVVDASLSDDLAEELADAPPGTFTYYRSTALDSERYIHGYPSTSPGVRAAEERWWRRARDAEAWMMPPRGRVRVGGYLKSRRGFEIWLGSTGGTNPKTDADGGTLGAARVDYDARAGTFEVLPLTGDMKVRCEIGGDSVTEDVGLGERVTLEL